jgi:Helix-turn-helix domain
VAQALKKGTRVIGVDRSRLGKLLGKRYDAGESIRALAASTGRSYGFVHRLLREAGVELRRRGGATRTAAAGRGASARAGAAARGGGSARAAKPRKKAGATAS